MTSPEGAFYSATDADSEGEEGKFFVWSVDEVKSLLGADAERFMRHYDVTQGGNFEGHNILNVLKPSESEWAALAGARKKLYDVRARRIPPLRDEKILAAWNGLMISGLAVGGYVLDEPKYVAAAARAAAFVLGEMTKDGRVLRSFKDGRAVVPGFLEDYVFLQAGLIDLYQATFDRKWLDAASALGEAVEKHFADEAGGGWFMTSDDAEKLIAREKPQYDGAEPSGTSVAILNALRLATYTTDDRWRAVADKALAGLSSLLADRAVAMTEALLAVDFRSDVAREVALVWPGAREGAKELEAILRTTFVPNKVVAGCASGDAGALGKTIPFIQEKTVLGGKATAYVCERGRCELPTSDPQVFRGQLDKVRGYP
jgi:uncharacterized protein YyaL (SSP411 family)